MEGVITYYKVSLIIFEECFDKLKETKSLSDFSRVIKEYFKNYSGKQIASFAKKLNQIFMNVQLINKLRQSITNKEYRLYDSQRQHNKLRFCGDSPICFVEINKLLRKDDNQHFSSADILSNLKHDHFKPWGLANSDGSLFQKKNG